LIDSPHIENYNIISNKFSPTSPELTINIPEQVKLILFSDISLSPFFDLFLLYVNSYYKKLYQHYLYIKSLADKYNPSLYITVNIANSEELVKMWGFRQSGVRTVWSSEGLGQPGRNLNIVVNSVFHPEVEVERWVLSKNFSKYFINNSMPVRVTGYLDNNTNHAVENKSTKSAKHQELITFTLSMVPPAVRRAIVGEDMFEMLDSIKYVSSVLSNFFPEYTLNLKLHPGDRQNIPLYKQQIDKDSKFRISMDESLNKIIDKSAIIIIYDTSVGLESMLRRKNVICFNHTNRDNYITSIYEFLNHDPAKGAAMLMATNESELKKCIGKLLPYSNNNKPSPGLEYVLENARSDYNAADVVKGLLNQ